MNLELEHLELPEGIMFSGRWWDGDTEMGTTVHYSSEHIKDELHLHLATNGFQKVVDAYLEWRDKNEH